MSAGHFVSSSSLAPNEVVISSEPLSKEGRVVLDSDAEMGDASTDGSVSATATATTTTASGHSGKWVLVRDGHMLVCVGDPRLPEKVRVPPLVSHPLYLHLHLHLRSSLQVSPPAASRCPVHSR